MAPSRELKLKKEKLKQHQEEFSNIEEIVYQTAGGISMDELLDLQKKIKKDLRLRTSRVDWRTKTGIILWFCEHWDIISKVINTYAVQSNTHEREGSSSPDASPVPEKESFPIEFPEITFNQCECPTFFEEENFEAQLYDNLWVL